MARIRSSHTGPEMSVHGHLKGNHVEHVMWPLMAGKPDVLIGKRVAVFVHGCFWHGCRRHFKCPATNASFWQEKIERNRKRHRTVSRDLTQAGYKVVVVWEHELASRTIAETIGKLIQRHVKE